MFLDEAEVVLTDGNRVLLMAIIDDASSFQVFVPTDALRSISGAEAKRCFDQGWMSWAGPPQFLYYDAAKGHLAEQFSEMGDRNSIVMRPVPAESPHLKGRIEKAIDFFKNHFAKVNQEMQLTVADNPHHWTSAIATACNNHVRRNGFTPYQYVLGRSPRIPTSLTETMEGDATNLSAHSTVLFDAGARRAEQIRAAAVKAFFELDTDDAVRRAIVGRVRPPRGPFVPGQLVYYWRAQGTKTMSKRLQGALGWRGPCIVVALEGSSRVHLSYRGVPVLVTPEQWPAFVEV